MIDRSGCSARYHGSVTAYFKHSCRCPDAGLAQSEYRRARANGTAVPGHVPAIATIRRLRGLYAAGHDARAIAAAAGMTPQHVRVLLGPDGSRRPERAGRALPDTVTRSTADAVTDAAARLSRIPGRSAAARGRAVRAGWPPLHVWDDIVFRIDDPDADEQLAATTAGMHPTLRAAVLADARAEAAAAAHRAEARRANVARARAARSARHTPTARRSA